MYGAAVLTAYGIDDKPPKLWVGALSKLTPAEAKQGIASLAKQGRSYPPNLTEVLEACRPKKPVRYLGGPSSMWPTKALPRPKANEDHVQQCLANMRRLFGASKSATLQSDLAEYERPACTCKSSGECDVCVRYATILDEVRG